MPLIFCDFCRRLTSAPAAEHLSLVAGLELSPTDACANAVMLRSRLGWSVLGGYILYESAETPGEYSAVPHWWNASPRGLWLDLTPRSEHMELVLVDSAQTAVPEPTEEERRRCDELRHAEGTKASEEAWKKKVEKAQHESVGVKMTAKEAKETMWVAKAAAKQDRRRRMDTLPESPYRRFLTAIDRLPEELLEGKPSRHS